MSFFTCFDTLLLNTVYMHSWNKTVNMLCVLHLVACCSLFGQLVMVSPVPQNWGLSAVQWFWMTGALKGFQTRIVSMNLSGVWTNKSERVWIIYTPLLVLSWQLGHRDCILNRLEHYNYFEPITGSLIFTLISVKWIGMQNLPYLCHFNTHLWETTLFYSLFFFFFFYKAKTCLRSREVLFSQPLYAYSF